MCDCIPKKEFVVMRDVLGDPFMESLYTRIFHDLLIAQQKQTNTLYPLMREFLKENGLWKKFIRWANVFRSEQVMTPDGIALRRIAKEFLEEEED